jgi:transcriptional regulator with XRE-family HTH domain
MKLLTIHELREKHGLTGARIGLLTGVSPRAVRRWLSTESSPNFTRIPSAALWLIHILLGEAAPKEIVRLAESRAKKKPRKDPDADPGDREA